MLERKIQPIEHKQRRGKAAAQQDEEDEDEDPLEEDIRADETQKEADTAPRRGSIREILRRDFSASLNCWTCTVCFEKIT